MNPLINRKFAKSWNIWKYENEEISKIGRGVWNALSPYPWNSRTPLDPSSIAQPAVLARLRLTYVDVRSISRTIGEPLIYRLRQGLRCLNKPGYRLAYCYCLYVWICKMLLFLENENSPMLVWCVSFSQFLGCIRLALNEVLRCQEGSLLLMAPCCKSFSVMQLGYRDDAYLNKTRWYYRFPCWLLRITPMFIIQTVFLQVVLVDSH